MASGAFLVTKRSLGNWMIPSGKTPPLTTILAAIPPHHWLSADLGIPGYQGQTFPVCTFPFQFNIIHYPIVTRQFGIHATVAFFANHPKVVYPIGQHQLHHAIFGIYHLVINHFVIAYPKNATASVGMTKGNDVFDSVCRNLHRRRWGCLQHRNFTWLIDTNS